MVSKRVLHTYYLWGKTMPNSENLTMLEKARIKAHDYADDWEDRINDLRADKGMSIHAILKNAYTQGYIDGFKLRLTGE